MGPDYYHEFSPFERLIVSGQPASPFIYISVIPPYDGRYQNAVHENASGNCQYQRRRTPGSISHTLIAGIYKMIEYGPP